MPVILCNVGSGVPIIHIEAFDKSSTVLGSGLGGASLLGFASKILGISDYN